MCYYYPTMQEALDLRNGKQGEPLLTEVLYKWLEQHNDYEYKGENYQFSASDPQQAVYALCRPTYYGSYPLGRRFELPKGRTGPTF
jgi:hypothetical protein